MNSVFQISTSDDQVVFHADWAEISCLFASDANVSEEDLYRAIYQDGGRRDETARVLAHDTFAELADRISACGRYDESAYPFELNERKNLVRFVGKGLPDVSLPYLFQLMICRWSMASEDRQLAGIDPTKVYERLCADVLTSFWGTCSGDSGAFVFGTASGEDLSTFPDKISHLTKILNEGGQYKKGATAPGAGDGKLDLVAYRRFKDGRPGSLVGFAQCKTGVKWRDHLTKLQPRAFVSEYMTSPLLLDPVRIYMVPQRIHHDMWSLDTSLGGLLFDRCRITQYSDRISDNVLADARRWLQAALDATKLPS